MTSSSRRTSRRSNEMPASQTREWPSKALFRVALFLALLAGSCSASRVVLKNNGYDGVVIALEDDIPASLCEEVLLGLEETMRAASSVIFSASRGRASFRSVRVLVPAGWGASAAGAPCPALHGLQDAFGETFDNADLRVTLGRHPLHGSRPWTLHSAGCGQLGDYISVGHQSLTQNNSLITGRQLARAWLEYRYGVFSEAGAPGDALHPPHYLAPDGTFAPNLCSNTRNLPPNPNCDPANITCPILGGEDDMEEEEEEEEEVEDEVAAGGVRGVEERWKGMTSSFMGLDLPTVTQLCDEGTHNRDAPTRHNLLCYGKSVWEVLRASPDFQNNRNVEGGLRESDITFTYVRPQPPKIVLLIDDTDVMNVQKRWEFVRKAVRKVVSYDVPDGYSVGLVVFDSSAAAKYPLTRLGDGATREKVGSSLPRNPSPEPHHRRCLPCGLREALRMLEPTSGTASQGPQGHVVLVTAEGGAGPLDEAQADEASRLLTGTGVVLHAVVYPLTERFPTPGAGAGLEALAAATGGRTYVVPDQGIGADSKLAMYYNLLDSLYTALAAATGPAALPVKVLAAEHPGGRAALAQGAFTLDAHLGADTVFAVFYYDVTHVGNLVHLVSPAGQVIDTANMQKEDANINMITVTLAAAQALPGTWRYRVENRADSHQALFVEVTSRPRASSPSKTSSPSSASSSAIAAPRVSVRAWTSHPLGLVNATDISRPLALFAEVRLGLAPVEDAQVTAVVTRLGFAPNGTTHEPFFVDLLDNGLTGPDMERGDGVYSRFVPGLPAAKYSVRLDIEGEVEGRRFARRLRMGVVDVMGVLPVSDVVAPARIVDLRAAVLPDADGGRVSFSWTAPGGDLDYGVADRYVVLSSRNIEQLREGGGNLVEGWPAPMEAGATQHHTSPWNHHDVVHHVALYAVDEHGNAAALSNVVRVYVPAPPPPSTTATAPSAQPPMAPADAASPVREASEPLPTMALDARRLAALLGCVGGAAALVALGACYCLAARRRQRKTAAAKKALDAVDGYAPSGKALPTPEMAAEAKMRDAKGDYLSPVESWSASQLLSSRNSGVRSSVSDGRSDHSASTKKSFGDSSSPAPDLFDAHEAYLPGYPGAPYAMSADGYALPDGYYPMPSDGYPTPTDGYPTPTDGYPMPSDAYRTPDGYVGEAYPAAPSEARSYISSPPPESFLSVSCEMLPSSHGPPAYAAYPSYDASLRSSSSGKVPPPIPPKPKVVYSPEPYTYEHQSLDGVAPTSPLAVEKRIRNITMV